MNWRPPPIDPALDDLKLLAFNYCLPSGVAREVLRARVSLKGIPAPRQPGDPREREEPFGIYSWSIENGTPPNCVTFAIHLFYLMKFGFESYASIFLTWVLKVATSWCLQATGRCLVTGPTCPQLPDLFQILYDINAMTFILTDKESPKTWRNWESLRAVNNLRW